MDFAEAKGNRNPKSMWERCSPHGTETWITFLPPSLTQSLPPISPIHPLSYYTLTTTSIIQSFYFPDESIPSSVITTPKTPAECVCIHVMSPMTHDHPSTSCLLPTPNSLQNVYHVYSLISHITYTI